MRIRQFLTIVAALTVMVSMSARTQASITFLGIYDAQTGGLGFSPQGLGLQGGNLISRGGAASGLPSGTNLQTGGSLPSLDPMAPTNLSFSTFGSINSPGGVIGDYSSPIEDITGTPIGTVSAGSLIGTYKESSGVNQRTFITTGGNNTRIITLNNGTGSDQFVGVTYHATRGTFMVLDTAGTIVELSTAASGGDPAGTELNTFDANPTGAPALSFSSSGNDGGDIEFVRNVVPGGGTFEAVLVVGDDVLRRVDLGSSAVLDFTLDSFGGSATGLAVDVANDLTYVSSTDGNIYVYGSVVATAVPEPGSFAVIACLGVAGAVRQRRLRKKTTAA